MDGELDMEFLQSQLWSLYKWGSEIVEGGPHDGWLALGAYLDNDQDFLISPEGFSLYRGERRETPFPSDVLKFVQDTCPHDEWLDDFEGRAEPMMVCCECGRERTPTATER